MGFSNEERGKLMKLLEHNRDEVSRLEHDNVSLIKEKCDLTRVHHMTEVELVKSREEVEELQELLDKNRTRLLRAEKWNAVALALSSLGIITGLIALVRHLL